MALIPFFTNYIELEEYEREKKVIVYYPKMRERDRIFHIDEGAIFEAFGTFGTFGQEVKNENPIFPFTVLPDRLQAFSIGIAESIQVAIDMVASTELATVSTAIQNKFYMNPKPDWNEPVNLYIVVIGEPSERKSPVIKAVTAPVWKYEDLENERRKPKIAEYLQRKKLLKKELEIMENKTTGKVGCKEGEDKPSIDDIIKKRAELDELEEVTPMRLIADNTTSEALIKLMAENNGCMSIISAEGGIFDIMGGLYSGGTVNIDVFTKAYSGDPIRTDRANKEGHIIDHPALTMMLAVQPSVIEEAVNNKAFRGRGLMARILYCWPPSRVGHRTFKTIPISKESEYMYNNLIERLLAIPTLENPHRIGFTEEAQDVLEKYFNEIESRLPDDLEEIGDWAGKLVGQSVRIAGVLHVCEYIEKTAEYEVSADTMRKAIEISNYYLDHSLYTLGRQGLLDSPEVKDAKYILKRWEMSKVPKVPEIPVRFVKTTVRDTWHLCKSHFKNVESMNPALDELERRGYIRRANVPTGGRPTTNIYFNPEYLGTLEMNKGDKQNEEYLRRNGIYE